MNDIVDSSLKTASYLAELLSPVSLDDFFSEYWDRKPLYIADGSARFAGLADAGRLREIVESGSPWQYRRLPELYLDSGFIPHDQLIVEYTDMDGRRAVSVRQKRVKMLLEAGATANCFGQEAHFPELMRLKKRFAEYFSAEVETSLFYSQQDHPGLAPHYDCVEIFVLQISGHKRWYVSSQRQTNPLVGYGQPVAYDNDAPHAVIDLEPGDLLYLPRGLFHHACALSGESLHTTVAVKMPSYFDLFKALAEVAVGSDDMRGYLPPGGPAAWAAAGPALLDRLSALLEQPAYAAEVQELLGNRNGSHFQA
ncbi:JmjC domain-containing protein [Chromobacterium sp. CV08]|uniref:JmjC domain-containing protein n=1 Tax=Chromobacterium sp. CV08 TaxID=3133274 RepID=UPI003DA8386D